MLPLRLHLLQKYRIVVVRCLEDGTLSEEITKLNVGSDAPYRMAMHPSGRSIVLGLTMGGILRVDVTLPAPSSEDPPVLQMNSTVRSDETNKRFGAVKSMSFSSDGRLLALGGEDGTVDIVAWPSLETKRRWKAAEKGIRNIDFSEAHADEVIACVDETGGCSLWYVASGECVSRLQPPADLPRATFFRCRSAIDDEGIALYTPVKFKGQGYILRWRQGEDGRLIFDARSQRAVTPSPICGFELSRSGRFSAAVTPDGDQCIISSSSLQKVKYRKGAHMTFATAVTFLPDDSGVVSTASDASARMLRCGHGLSHGSLLGDRAFLLLVSAIVMVVFAVLLGFVRRQLATMPSDDVRALMEQFPSWARRMLVLLTSSNGVEAS